MNQRTWQAVEQQISAMGVQVFEVGLFKPGATPEMLPRVWDRDMLLRSIPWLRHENANGRNIYIRPQGEHALSLVDDLTADAVGRMKAEGFQPAVVVETSPGNFQAWLNHGQVLPRRLSTAVARTLAKEFGGDLGAADWRHFGRLAGFTNRKGKYRDSDGQCPFVRLIEVDGQAYDQAQQLVAQVADALAREHHGMVTATPSRQHGQLKTIDDFRADPRYAGDGNRIDLAYAIYAFSHGVSEPELRSAIGSRDLSKKGSERRQTEYIDRTLDKAKGIRSRVQAVSPTPERRGR